MKQFRSISDERPTRLCFLGCGKITATHSKTIKKLKHNVELSYSSRDGVKALAYKKKYGGINSYPSYSDAINDDWADVIMICVPPAFHFELAQKVLLANKHLILEKPAVCSVKEFDDLIAISSPQNLQVMVSENYYYRPMRKFLKDNLHNSVIGSILSVNINAVKNQKSDGWRADRELSPMGAMFEGGIHWLSIINNIGYKFKSINSFFPLATDGLDKASYVTFETEDGPTVNFLYSWEGNPLINGLGISSVYGTKGMIRFENNGLFVWVRGKKIKLKLASISKLTGFKPMFEDFFKALINDHSPKYDIFKARLDLETIEKIYKSKT